MSSVILSLVEQKLKDRIASDLERMKMAVNHELQGRAVDFYWNDPHDRNSPPQLVKGEISSAGFDMCPWTISCFNSTYFKRFPRIKIYFRGVFTKEKK